MKVNRQFVFEPDYAIPPGATLKETIETLGMSQQEFAIRTGLTGMSLNRIFRGEQPISYETANALEMATGAPARFWNNLEARYRERLLKIEERKRSSADLNWLRTIPVRELINRGILQATVDMAILLKNTLGFYGVSSVAAWRELWARPAVAARRSACFESLPGPASAWIRLGELQAQKQECQPYARERLVKNIPGLRSLSRENDVSVMIQKMRDICAECGVALAVVQEMKKVPWNGATKWLTPDKVMVVLNLRGKGEDKFWFSFFHEIGHVLHDSKKDLLINDGRKDDMREIRADEYAAEALIPAKYNLRISTAKNSADIQKLADELSIAPGIVAGRYQHLTKNWVAFRGLIRTFVWSKQ